MFLFRDVLENKKNLRCDEILSLKLEQQIAVFSLELNVGKTLL